MKTTDVLRVSTAWLTEGDENTKLSLVNSATTPSSSEPLAIRFRLQYADVETFVEKYARNISEHSMFVASLDPPAEGTVVRLELSISGGQPILRGEGEVTQCFAFDPERPLDPSGMTVRFRRMDEEGQRLMARVLAFKARTEKKTPEAAQTAASPVLPSDAPSAVTPKLLDEELAELLRRKPASSVTPTDAKEKLQELLDRRLRSPKT
jgi:uncharacterized protein (TIGR02266 family)